VEGANAKLRSVLQSLTTRASEAGKGCRRPPATEVANEGEAGARELAFSADGSEVLATFAEAHCASFDPCGTCAEDYTPARVLVSDGKLKDRWEAAPAPLFAACSAALGVPVTPDEKGGAVAWGPDGKVTQRWGSPGAPAVRCAIGGSVLALLSRDGVFLQPRNGGPVKRLMLSGDPVALAVSPDGKHVLAASEKEVQLLGLPEGRSLETLPLRASGDAPRAVAFSPDGQAFAVATRRGVVLEFGLLVPPR
jgi:hypothetical protein